MGEAFKSLVRHFLTLLTPYLVAVGMSDGQAAETINAGVALVVALVTWAIVKLGPKLVKR